MDTAPVTVLVGREAELRTLLGCLGHARPRAATVVAAAGLGKSSLIEAFREALTGHDLTLLTARPLETEAHLAFAALGELVAPVPPEEYDVLPVPQRTAIRTALLLDDGDPSDPRAVAAAVRGVLTALAERHPLVLLVDDAQWLDDATAAVLGQVLRRLGDVPVLLVAAARPTGRPLDEWLPGWPREQLELAPLSMSALFHVVRQHLDIALDRGQLRAVEQASGGNPLHALEFARHRAFGPGASFEALLSERLLALPRPTRRALLAAALCSAPTVSLVAEALGADPERLLDDLQPAVAGRLVRAQEAVQFQHPLYLEAAVDAAATEERAALHRRLAEVEPLEEARVRHLARASTGPDAKLADRLDEAARAAWDRGAWAAGAELMRLAVDRTPDADHRHTRMLVLEGWLVTSGSPGEAERLLEELRSAASGTTYWQATIDLALLLNLSGRYDESRLLAREVRGADLPLELRARALFDLEPDVDEGAALELWLAAAGSVNADLALLPAHPGLTRLRATGLAQQARLLYGAGQSGDEELALAIELDRREPTARILDSPLLIRAQQLMNAYAHEEARTAYAELHRRAVETGDDLSLPLICAQWGYLELRAGDLARAYEIEEEGLRVAEPMGQEVYFVLLGMAHASLEGMRGDKEPALAALAALRPRVEAVGDLSFESIWWQCNGRVLLAHGDLEAAHDACSAGWQCALRAGWTDPGDLNIDADYVETLIGTGRLDEAKTHLADAVRRARESGRDPVLVECERGRVALRAATGRLEEAAAAIPAMLAGFDGPHRPLERAKAYLVAGKVHRRAGARRRAHDVLTTARELFEALGSPPYAAQAAAELGRVGLRPRAPEGLTETELQIATLAAQGLRNKEIAGMAFVSPKTVEAALSRAYRKLGIRSRAQLAVALEYVRD